MARTEEVSMEPDLIDPATENWAEKDDAEVYHAAKEGHKEAIDEAGRREPGKHKEKHGDGAEKKLSDDQLSKLALNAGAPPVARKAAARILVKRRGVTK